MADLLIEHVTIVDGTGQPAFTGSIAVEGETITHIVRDGSRKVSAPQVIEASGLYAVPGFVDIHRHGDLLYTDSQPGAEELRLGITSFVNGNCGFSPAPSSPQFFHQLQQYARPIMGPIPQQLEGAGFAQFMGLVQDSPLYANMGFLVGSGALRIAVKGFDPSPLSPVELAAVKDRMGEAFAAGALGLSMGLMYVPENFYTTDELAELAAVAAQAGRIVTVHMRGEGSSLLDSVDEVVQLAERTGGAFHISHLKAAGKKNWLQAVPKALETIEQARRQGLDISFDVYPYTAGSTALYTLFPPHVQAGGMEAMLDRLSRQDVRRKLERDLEQEQPDWDNLVASTGWQSVIIAGGGAPELVGHSVDEIAAQRGVSPQTCAIDLLIENQGNVPIVFYSMSEGDMEQILHTPGAIVISDALYAEGGLPHPRRYGSQARLLARYSEAMGIEQAVRCVTSLPAQRMGLENRGCLLEGWAADLLLLDRQTLEDTATYTQPVQYPRGIRAVVVNGALAMDEMGKTMGPFGKLLSAAGIT